MSRNELYIQQWMEEHEIAEGVAWRRDIIEGRDPFGLYADHPQISQIETVRDDFGASPLYYYCFVATPQQLEILLNTVPENCWTQKLFNSYYCSPLFYVIKSGNLDTIQWMMQWLFPLDGDHREATFNSPLSKTIYHYLLQNRWFFYSLMNGHTHVAQWLLSNDPSALSRDTPTCRDFIDQKMIFDLFHYGSFESIQWALSDAFPDKYKHYLNTVVEAAFIQDMKSVFINAMRNCDQRVIRYVLSSSLPTKFGTVLDKSMGSYVFFHNLASHADFETIQWIFTSPNMKYIKDILCEVDPNDHLKRTVFQRGIYNSGINKNLFKKNNPPLPSEFKQLLLKKDADNNTFLRQLASNYNANEMTDFITSEPELAASMWVANKNGDTINSMNLWYHLKSTKITALNLLKSIIRDALTRIANHYPAIDTYDSRLLIAFKERTLGFLKDPAFIEKELMLRLSDCGALQRIFGELTDGTLTIILKLQRYQPTRLNAALFDEIIVDLEPRMQLPKISGFTFFFGPSAIFIRDLIEDLIKIRDALRDRYSDEIKQQSAILIKLFLLDKKYDALPQDDKHILVMLRNILFRTDEVGALMPRQVESAGTVVAEENIDRELAAIETDLRLTADPSNIESALRVLNGVRYLLPHFDEINAFAKAHPRKLYYLDAPEQSALEFPEGKLPFHLDEYGTDDSLQNTLLRIVREYIAAFHIAKNAGKSAAFFDKTTQGFCLDGRMRDVVTWTAEFMGVDTFDELMGKYIFEYQAHLSVVHGIINVTEMRHFIDCVADFVLRYHENELYQEQYHYDLQLFSIEKPVKLETQTLYIRESDDKAKLEYRVIGLDGKQKMAHIPLEKLTSVFRQALAQKNRHQLKQLLPQLLEITTNAKHTPAACVKELSRPVVESYLRDMLCYDSRGFFS
jgi:hypothetical protein